MSSKFNLSKAIQNAINNRKEDLKDIGCILRNVEVGQPSKEAVKTVRHATGKINGKASKNKLKLSDSISGSINSNVENKEVPNILTSEEKISNKELEDLIFSDKELRKIATDNAEHFMSIHKVYLDVVFGVDCKISYDKQGTTDCIVKDCYYVNYTEEYAGITKNIEIEFPNLIQLEKFLIREWNLI